MKIRNLKRLAKKLIIGTMCSGLFLGALSCSMVTVYAEEFFIDNEENDLQEARTELAGLVADMPIMAAVYLCDKLPLQREPSWDSDFVRVERNNENSAHYVELPSGTMVLVKDACIDEYGNTWLKVGTYYGEGDDAPMYEGYIPRYNLAISDERYLEWEDTYSMHVDTSSYGIMSLDQNDPDNTPSDIAQFPESYHASLMSLKQAHPNWTFVPLNTGLDWQTSIDKELEGGKSLVYKTFPAYDKEGAYDDGNWFYASEDILKLYMDPRNALHENAIFQFEMLTYNETYHTEEALDVFLNNTFMKNTANAPKTDMTYGHIIWATGRELGVSPFHLASRIYQEQGDGKSELISGTYTGHNGDYYGYYNYFNIGATGTTTTEVIENGLKYAKTHYVAGVPWNSAYYSIYGGSKIISANYILKGQGTLYLQKFNVNPASANAVYTHQYMQNISAPTTEAATIKKLYASAGALDSPFVFVIPVYENMPDTPCPNPTSSNSVILNIPSGYDASTVYVDGVACSTKYRNGYYVATAPVSSGTNAVVYSYNSSNVPTGMYVWGLNYSGGVYTPTAQTGLTDLLSYHGFSIRITGKSGIRFKSGISANTRAALLSDLGINGYKLKEYGTLVMNNANRDSYPMIKGGEKVLSGIAYGTDANGDKQDAIYETVDGRYHFTSVLVGLPATQYKTEFAFRSYCVLTKDGKDIVIYGPIVARSIYGLAQTVLDAGIYENGSQADLFLRGIIADGDAAQ